MGYGGESIVSARLALSPETGARRKAAVEVGGCEGTIPIGRGVKQALAADWPLHPFPFAENSFFSSLWDMRTGKFALTASPVRHSFSSSFEHKIVGPIL